MVLRFFPEYAQIARDNAAQNNFEFEVQVGDVSARPTPFNGHEFHQIIMNPPYFEANSSSISPDAGRASGRAEVIALSHWVDTAAKRLRPRGYLTLIQRVERLPEHLGPSCRAPRVCVGTAACPTRRACTAFGSGARPQSWPCCISAITYAKPAFWSGACAGSARLRARNLREYCGTALNFSGMVNR